MDGVVVVVGLRKEIKMLIVLEEVFPEYVYSNEKIIYIPILDTDEINTMIDAERVKHGMTPFFNGDVIDTDGWYEVRLIIDKKTEMPQEIEAWVAEDCGAEEKDNDIYTFSIDKEDVKRQLDELQVFKRIKEAGRC